MKWLLLYLLIINIISFLLYGIDKWKATYNRWRIRENTLIGVAIVGGSVGSILGMHLFRHKTKHLKFTLGLPAILIVQVVRQRSATPLSLVQIWLAPLVFEPRNLLK